MPRALGPAQIGGEQRSIDSRLYPRLDIVLRLFIDPRQEIILRLFIDPDTRLSSVCFDPRHKIVLRLF